eukprot:2645439-Prymnesium_polylepis.1
MQQIVADHVIQSRVMFPGAGHLELARSACSSLSLATVLHGVFFLQPLVLEIPGLLVECIVTGSGSKIAGHFEVRSGTSSGLMDEPAVHCSGDGGQKPLVTDGGEAARRCLAVGPGNARSRRGVRAVEVAALYKGFYTCGLQYGPEFRRIVHAWAG